MSPVLAQKKPKNRYHHGDLRRALVNASVAMVDAEGAAALTLRGVARRLGVSHAAPGHHFPDRPALLAAVAARGFTRLAEATEQARDRASTPVERLSATGVAYVEFASKHPELFRLMFGPDILDAGSDPDLTTSSTRAFEVLVNAVIAALGNEATPERVRVTTTAAWSLVHGLATLFIDRRLGALGGGTPADVKRVAREITGLVGRALEVA
jgi:AcrR family transcriptional regulator